MCSYKGGCTSAGPQRITPLPLRPRLTRKAQPPAAAARAPDRAHGLAGADARRGGRAGARTRARGHARPHLTTQSQPQPRRRHRPQPGPAQRRAGLYRVARAAAANVCSRPEPWQAAAPPLAAARRHRRSAARRAAGASRSTTSVPAHLDACVCRGDGGGAPDGLRAGAHGCCRLRRQHRRTPHAPWPVFPAAPRAAHLPGSLPGRLPAGQPASMPAVPVGLPARVRLHPHPAARGRRAARWSARVRNALRCCRRASARLDARCCPHGARRSAAGPHLRRRAPPARGPDAANGRDDAAYPARLSPHRRSRPRHQCGRRPARGDDGACGSRKGTDQKGRWGHSQQRQRKGGLWIAPTVRR